MALASATPIDDTQSLLLPARPRARLATRLLDGPGWTTLRVGVDIGVLTAIALAWISGGTWADRWPLLTLVPVTVASIFWADLYRRRIRVQLLNGVLPLGRAIIVGAATAGLTCAYATRALPLGSLLLMTVTAYVAVGATRMSLTALQKAARVRGEVARPTLIVGSGVVGTRVARRLLGDPASGLRPVGFLDRPMPTGPQLPLPLLGGWRDLEDVVAEHDVRHIVLAFSSTGDRLSVDLVTRAQELGVELSVVPRLFDAINDRATYETIGGLPLIGLRLALTKHRAFLVKHACDRILAGLALLVLSPVMAAIALAVKLSSPGPVIFRQRRSGLDGVEFDLLKFRSMRGAPTEPVRLPKGMAPGGVEGVDRRTAVGRVIRRTSLDELPQLVNVLRGEMSLVGPRPERPELVMQYASELDGYFERHRVRSGITGLAQVNGLRGKTSLQDRIELDNSYIQHWSLSLDVKILLLTVLALFRHAE